MFVNTEVSDHCFFHIGEEFHVCFCKAVGLAFSKIKFQITRSILIE